MSKLIQSNHIILYDLILSILISRRVLLNNSLSSQQSFIFIRLSTGKIFCLAIHHSV